MIEAQMLQHLKDNVNLVEGRVFALVMHQDTKKPAITYSVIKESVDNFCASKRVREWQIDIYADEYLQAKEVKEEVLTALKSFSVGCLDIEITDAFEQDAELFMQQIKFTTRS